MENEKDLLEFRGGKIVSLVPLIIFVMFCAESM